MSALEFIDHSYDVIVVDSTHPRAVDSWILYTRELFRTARERLADDGVLVQAVFAEFTDIPTAVVHGDPGASNIRMTPTGQVGLLDWDESRVDVIWHDLSNLGVQVLDQDEHQRALALSDAWEAANAWTTEPNYASTRLARLKQHRNA